MSFGRYRSLSAPEASPCTPAFAAYAGRSPCNEILPQVVIGASSRSTGGCHALDLALAHRDTDSRHTYSLVLFPLRRPRRSHGRLAAFCRVLLASSRAATR